MICNADDEICSLQNIYGDLSIMANGTIAFDTLSTSGQITGQLSLWIQIML